MRYNTHVKYMANCAVCRMGPPLLFIKNKKQSHFILVPTKTVAPNQEWCIKKIADLGICMNMYLSINQYNTYLIHALLYNNL